MLFQWWVADSASSPSSNAHMHMDFCMGVCTGHPNSCHMKVLSRNMFFGGKMAQGKCALGRGLGPFPQENVSVPLSKHIYLSVFTVRQELSQYHYNTLNCNWKILGREASLPPPTPSSFNPAYIRTVPWLLDLTRYCSITHTCVCKCVCVCVCACACVTS